MDVLKPSSGKMFDPESEANFAKTIKKGSKITTRAKKFQKTKKIVTNSNETL